MSDRQNEDQAKRLGGLRRFAAAITILNILGHTVFGFEPAWAQPLVALATAYGMELLLEAVGAWAHKRRPKFLGTPREFVDFLLPAHITALAVAMLLYADEQYWMIAFATAAAIASKTMLRAPVGRGRRHFFNPSNFGITITLLLFPVVGIAPPYQFTELFSGAGDFVLPCIIIASGTFLNAKFTGRLPLIAAWLCGFALQACVRSLVFGTPAVAALTPMTGVAFILFTFYMVTDPATSPARKRSQILFGAGVAAVYGFLVVCHIVFGLFFSLTIVCALRGVRLYADAFEVRQQERARLVVQSPAAANEA
ncbi:MAG TPA: RnfABCDGE type electron transport complex subunit D [Pyrinomonadaceae bacterium]|nr:RnfABCDGE type electron transport complex subunit D [Pyrinomonadaceae bacterium]